MDSKHVYLVFILGTMIFTMFAIALIVFLIHHKRKQQLHFTEKLNLEHQYQTQLLQTRLEVQEQAFKYLSEEIHDNVGQALSMVKLQLYAISQQVKDASQHTLIHTTNEVLTKAISDLRNISHNLHGGYVSRNGLHEAVEKEVNYINGAKAIHASLNVSGIVYSLSPEKELLVFRIIQEAVNNALKHANAESVEVSLSYQPENLVVMIKDDGNGFDINDTARHDGLGLSNMKTRTDLLTGHLSVSSEKGKGTIITLIVNSKTN